MLTKPVSALNFRTIQVGTSFLVLLMAEANSVLMRLLYSVVFDPGSDYNSNGSDSDVSLSDNLWFNSPEHYVRYSSISILAVL